MKLRQSHQNTPSHPQIKTRKTTDLRLSITFYVQCQSVLHNTMSVEQLLKHNKQQVCVNVTVLYYKREQCEQCVCVD